MPKHVDEKGQTSWTRIVYVIALDPGACLDGRATCGGCGKTPVYVGETCHTAKERFAQHKRGYKASRWVKRYGVKVTTGHTKGYGEFVHPDESRRAERKLAQDLGATGRYCVYGGH